MTPNIVLILSAHHPILTERLKSIGFTPVVHLTSDPALLDVEFNQVCGIVTSNACILNREQIDLFPNLRFIGRLGSGMEIIDVAYAESKGICCWGSPNGNAQAVAEHALGMLLNLLNHISKSQSEMRVGKFLRKENTGREISDLNVGIIGYGANGSRFADILHFLGATLWVHDIRDIRLPYEHNATFSQSIDDILEHCDVVSLHIPINKAAQAKTSDILSGMKRPFILINCARGGLVPIEDLYQGLKTGRISGACIDVWQEEPLEKLPHRLKLIAQEIVQMPNVIATPHIAGYSFQAAYKMSQIIADKIEEWCRQG